MITAGRNKNLGNLVEQKILEFFGDPDAGLELKKPFLSELRKRLGQKQRLTPHSEVEKQYGLR